MSKPNLVPPSLDFLVTAGKPKSPANHTLPVLPGNGDLPANVVIVGKDEIRKTHGLPATPVKPADVVKLTLYVPPDIEARMYAEAFHDPAHRNLKTVWLEILKEGLAKRPDKGPAAPEWIAERKQKGKRKKS